MKFREQHWCFHYVIVYCYPPEWWVGEGKFTLTQYLLWPLPDPLSPHPHPIQKSSCDKTSVHKHALTSMKVQRTFLRIHAIIFILQKWQKSSKSKIRKRRKKKNSPKMVSWHCRLVVRSTVKSKNKEMRHFIYTSCTCQVHFWIEKNSKNNNDLQMYENNTNVHNALHRHIATFKHIWTYTHKNTQQHANI